MKSSLDVYAILACPSCKSLVEVQKSAIRCTACALSFGRATDGTPVMVTDLRVLRTDKTPSPSLIRRALRGMVPHGRFPGIDIGFNFRAAVAEIYSTRINPVVINVGSGPTRLHPTMINVDIYDNPFVDVIADAQNLPFVTGGADAVICDSILEHVVDPFQLASELVRVLKPGGYLHVVAPFVFPYHESPIDCWRYTTTGMEILFNQCQKIRSGYLKGPCSAYARVTASFLAAVLSFNSGTLFRIEHSLLRLLLHPFGYLDYIVKDWRYSHLIGSGAFFWGTKK